MNQTRPEPTRNTKETNKAKKKHMPSASASLPRRFPQIEPRKKGRDEREGERKRGRRRRERGRKREREKEKQINKGRILGGCVRGSKMNPRNKTNLHRKNIAPPDC